MLNCLQKVGLQYTFLPQIYAIHLLLCCIFFCFFLTMKAHCLNSMKRIKYKSIDPQGLSSPTPDSTLDHPKSDSMSKSVVQMFLWQAWSCDHFPWSLFQCLKFNTIAVHRALLWNIKHCELSKTCLPKANWRKSNNLHQQLKWRWLSLHWLCYGTATVCIAPTLCNMNSWFSLICDMWMYIPGTISAKQACHKIPSITWCFFFLREEPSRTWLNEL